MSVLSPSDLALLKAAQAKIDQRREWLEHERQRGRGRPDVPLHVFQEGRAAAAAGAELRRAQLAIALHPRSTDDERRAAARAAVEALPSTLGAYAGKTGGDRRRRARAVFDVARELRDALERGRRGHLAARGNSAVYVQQEDFDDLVPDGWGKTFPAACKRLARQHGLAPLSFPLLTLLAFCRSITAASPTGAGLQASIEWLSKKLGCTDTWTKTLLNRLDPQASWRRELAAVRRVNHKRRRAGEELVPEPKKPQGVPLCRRFRQLKLYATTKQRDGGRAAFWLDAQGRPRQWVDVRGVVYATAAGCNMLIRRPTAETPRPRRTNPLWQQLQLELRRLRWRIAARLRRGAGPVENPVRSSPEKSTAPPRRRASFGQRVAT